MPFVESGVVYPDAEDALGLYAETFGCSLQEARDQLRYEPGLQSACDRAPWWALHESADITLQAAVLAHGIAETQPFIGLSEGLLPGAFADKLRPYVKLVG